jgi:RNA polymerase sigma-70 factor (ECF subfamily)
MHTIEDAQADQAAMRRLAAGQEAALDELMARHAEPLFHYLHRLLANEEDAEDLAQETFVRVHQNRARFRPAEKFTTWLYTIATNLARNRHRWRTRHPNVSLDTTADDSGASLGDLLPSPDREPAEALAGQETQAAVRNAVGQLPEDLRMAIILCEWQELSLAEAADILNTTIKAVESRLYRARKQLRAALVRYLPASAC